MDKFKTFNKIFTNILLQQKWMLYTIAIVFVFLLINSLNNFLWLEWVSIGGGGGGGIITGRTSAFENAFRSDHLYAVISRNSLLVPLLFSALTTSIIFGGIFNSYLMDKIVVNQNIKNYEFVFWYTIVNIIYVIIIWTCTSLFGLYIMIQSDVSVDSTYISRFPYWYFYGVLSLSFATIFFVWISTFKIERTMKIIIIFSVFFSIFIVPYYYIGLSKLLEKVDATEDYFKNNIVTSLITILPFVLWSYILNPLSMMFDVSHYMYSIEFIDFLNDRNEWQYLNATATIKAISWVHIMELVLLLPTLMFGSFYNLENNYE